MAGQKKRQKFFKQATFNPNETLQQALKCVSFQRGLQSGSEFMPLFCKIPLNVALSEQQKNFCQETFILLSQNPIPIGSIQKFKSFQSLLDDVIHVLISNDRKTFVQCIGQQYKDFALVIKAFNFSKTILQTSLIQKLFDIISQKQMYHLLCNYTILMKYKNEYVQVSGKPLSLHFVSKFTDKKKTSGKNVYMSYKKPQILNRFQVFYCSSANRKGGIFHKNNFFDKGLIPSTCKEQINITYAKFLSNNVNTKIKFLKTGHQIVFKQFVYKMFLQTRRVFSLKTFKGKKCSFFDCLMKSYCPLPENFKEIKKSTQNFIFLKEGRQQDIFQSIYKHASQYISVANLIKALVRQIVPKHFLGVNNYNIFLSLLKKFVKMKRYENLRVQDFLYEMNVFDLQWLQLKFDPKYKNQIIRRGRRVLSAIITLIVNQIICPVLKYNYYVTQKHSQANRMFYYRKPLWILISKLAIMKFGTDNLSILGDTGYNKKSSQNCPEGKLRILPKKGTFRPIITFNRKKKVIISPNQVSRLTLNQKLYTTQLVLRNLKNMHWQDMGYSVFDNRQIRKKYDDFVKRWRQKGCPQIYYFTLDIRKCYDSIDTKKLQKIIEETPLLQNYYLIKKYNRLYRNKRALMDKQPLPVYFNLKDRVAACSLSRDLIQNHQNQSIPAFTIFMTKQNSISKHTIIQNLHLLCSGSIINYKKQYWLQKMGIPQGLNVSGVLCSLYFGTLEAQHVNVKEGVLMRLTDDYLYLGQLQQAKSVLSGLLKCSRQNNFEFSENKISKNFYHPQILKYDEDKKDIIWIGKKINIQTLEMCPYFELNQKLGYKMNVTLKKKNSRSIIKNKLKSLLTNHFQSYFNPKIFSVRSNLRIIRLQVQLSLQKLSPFLKQYFILRISNPERQLYNLLNSTFNEYMQYICRLMKTKRRKIVYLVKSSIYSQAIDFFKKRKNNSLLKFLYEAFVSLLKRIKKRQLLETKRKKKNLVAKTFNN